MTDATGIASALTQAINDHDFAAASSLVEEIIAGVEQGRIAATRGAAKALVRPLRAARLFRELGRVTETMMRTGVDEPAEPLRFDPSLRKLYAQSLIEQQHYFAAIDTLRTGIALIAALPEVDYRNHDSERREMLGLLGRAYKQIYMNSIMAWSGASSNPKPSAEPLRIAIDWYSAACLDRDAVAQHWPLINKIALIARAEREGSVESLAEDPLLLARKAIAELLPEATCGEPRDKYDRPWLRASLAEAYLAIGDHREAARWYGAYADTAVDGQRPDAFALSGTIRQLEEVWQIDADDPGPVGDILRMLKLRRIELPDGGLVVGDDIGLLRQTMAKGDELIAQSILGGVWPDSLRSLRRGLDIARSIAGVYVPSRDQPIGTAFVVRGSELFPAWGDGHVVVTAAHVVPGAGETVRPGSIRLQFDELDRGRRYRCGEILHTSPTLDFTVMRISDLPAGVEAIPVKLFEDLPAAPELLDAHERICRVVGHPLGHELAVSLDQARLIDFGFKNKERAADLYLRYTASTLGGQSGGPVFDREWNVIGVHLAGINPQFEKSGIRRLSGRPGRHFANEGIALKTISEEIAASAGKATSPVLPRPSAIAATVPRTLEQFARAVADVGVADETLLAWLAEPEFETVLADEAARASGQAQSPEGYRDASDVFKYGLAVALSKVFRERRNWAFAKTRKDPRRIPLTFVSEGDSWFQYPWPTVHDTIDHLSNTYPIYCRAIAGMEFQSIFANTTELMAAIQDFQPDGILLSGGGNDLLGDGRVANHVRQFTPGLAAAGYLESGLDEEIASIVALFEKLVARALQINSNLKFFVHGYDRALPREAGRWLRVPLGSQCQIRGAKLQQQIVAAIVDRYNDALAAFAARRPGVVHHVDCRGAVGGRAEWMDELHPRNDGFNRVAQRFDAAIRDAFKEHEAFAVRKRKSSPTAA